ncbi:wall-associated receptor kinase 2-like [Humulus lupulus]|uniref:wall-associated receptor kinase 2-like n=1 Tax=Humulus lupulus TaxID=3486 RepID=UPI002B4134B5|nr:wall-associated receptor kinase 2-like [Humulus lupulus]
MALPQNLIPPRLLLLQLTILVLGTKTITSQPNNTINNGSSCLDRCGSVSILYPFGTAPGCYYDESFLVTCNYTTTTINATTNSSPKLFLPTSNVSILDISLIDGELRVEGPIARNCYNKLGNLTSTSSSDYDTVSMLTNSKFPISSRRNMLAAVGCDTLVLIRGMKGRNYSAGCIAMCEQLSDIANGSCSGVGCCSMSVPEDVIDFFLSVESFTNHSEVYDFNPCDYSFVVEEQAYNFSSIDLKDFQKRDTVPLILDWAVGNWSCEQAQQNDDYRARAAYACQSSYSFCLNSTNGHGYRCKCLDGYQGNPYLIDGCQDINECDGPNNPCVESCTNLPGSFSCSCPKGSKGDGTKEGTGCTSTGRAVLKISIALGISISLLLLVMAGSWTYWALNKRKLIKLREKFFQENGGMLFQQQLVHQRGSSETTKIFTAEQLKKATNNYDQSRVLGQGGYGTVYKGVLSDNKVVAIKKSKIGNQSQIEQFINEVIVLSQINHRNVVNLLGCCLETEVPMLVYEFITNGTLSAHIHDEHKHSLLSWEMRLKIATETAGAIAYLHSSTSMPIIHRDIKTANILLDENYTTKVADFGASRLVPLDQTQLTTLVQGTLGYLDPEYFQTSQLTEKSDVYSFGVVLTELLTGQQAICFNREQTDRNLAMYFISSMKEGKLLQILDERLVNDGNIEQLNEVANVAKSCLRMNGEERPTMKEVAIKLEGLIKQTSGMHQWGQDHYDPLTISSEHIKYLLNPSNLGEHNNGATSTMTTSEFDSTIVQMVTQPSGR